MKKQIFILGFMTFLFFAQAQNTDSTITNNVRRTCGTKKPSAEWLDWFNKKVEEYKLNSSAGKIQQTNYVVPVIVHIIHGGQAVGTYPNISQAQVSSQITVLNQDFAGTGLNSGNLASTGFSVVGAANCNITFCLAQKDPDGNILPEPGIERISYVSQGWSSPGSFNDMYAFMSYMDGTIKASSIWDPARYLNVWVSDCNPNVGLLGYATFPAGSTLPGINFAAGTSSDDGLFVWAKSFGNIGTLQPGFDLGRTATHELGHYFGLIHISGDAQCGNDYCNDTPPQQAQSQGCPTYPSVSCSNGPNGDMFMNFMDYSDHACMYMFSPDQNTRIQTAMANSPFRNQLTASSATLCDIPTTAPVANFSVQATTCIDSATTLKSQISGNPFPTYSWAVIPSAGVTFSPSNTVPSPKIIFSTPGNYTVTMTCSNSVGSSTTSKLVGVDVCDVGIHSVSAFKNSIALFPNPSPGLVHITTNQGANQNIEITVYNAIGERLLFSRQAIDKSESLSIDLSKYPSGLYIVSLYNGKERAFERVILSK